MKSQSEPTNLVTAFRDLKKSREGLSLAAVLREVNPALGRNYRNHHITRMERGERTPDQVFHNYMLRYVLEAELGRYGLTKNQIEAIYERTRLAEKPGD